MLPMCLLTGFWGLWYPLETIKTRIQSDHPDQKLRVYKVLLTTDGNLKEHTLL
jgi:hypothetical protein